MHNAQENENKTTHHHEHEHTRDSCCDHSSTVHELNTDPSIDDVANELSKTKDQLLRTLAEQENLRRRAQKEKEDGIKYGISNFAKDMISIADNLERALAVKTENALDSATHSLLTGVDMVYKELLNLLQKHGVNKINAVGAPFDPNVHQAVAEVPATKEHLCGNVATVMQEGYVLHDRLLRPAMVTVAKAQS